MGSRIGSIGARAAVIALLSVTLSGCSTHELRFEANVPPPNIAPRDLIRWSETDADRLILGYTDRAPGLPTETLAALAKAAATGWLATRTDGAAHASDWLRAAARVYADALLQRGVRIPKAPGIAFAAAVGGGPSPRLTVGSADALIDVYLVTSDRRYGRTIGLAAHALLSPALGWRAIVPSQVGLSIPDASQARAMAAGGRARYDVVLTASVARFLERAAQVGIAPSSPASPAQTGRLLAAERSASRLAFASVEAQLRRGLWDAYLGATEPMSVTQEARTLYALESPSSPSEYAAASRGVAGLTAVSFTGYGAPTTNRVVDARGLPGILALLSLNPQSTAAQRVFRWGLGHLRSDGTVATAANADTPAQASWALALERRAYVLQRTTLPFP